MVINALSTLPQLSPADSDFKTLNAVLNGIGLLVIAIGTGGIKPCVSSFGGDQFHPEDDKNTSLFFDLFYWAVNAGSLISTFVSPLLRESTCGSLGTEDSCFFIAFGVPVILMAIALFAFLAGTKYYQRNPASGFNIFWEVIRCIFLGAFRKVPKSQIESDNKTSSSPIEDYDHWLYGAYGSVPNWVIRDTKYVVRVLVVFLPLPIFWAAFDQQGSRWTLQSIRMNGWLGSIHILPDEVQILNPVMILLFIPIAKAIYTCIDNCAGKKIVTDLRKIAVGIFFAAVAYIVAAIVQNSIDTNLTVVPSTGNEMSLRVLNLHDFTITGLFDGELPDELSVGVQNLAVFLKPQVHDP